MRGVGTLPIEQVADFAGLLDGQRCVSASVGPNGEALLLTVRERVAPALEAPTAHRHPVSAAVVVHDGLKARRTQLKRLGLRLPLAQPLPGGEMLVVGRVRGIRPDRTRLPNGSIYGPDGVIRHQFIAGDGIADAQADASGRIWVSYDDEGVFGNNAWKRELGGSPPSGGGLIKLDRLGIVLWQYRWQRDLRPIANCHALNVASDGAWICYYPDYPLVHIAKDGEVRYWPTDILDNYVNYIPAPRALAVGEGSVLFALNRYYEDDHFVLARLGERRLERARVITLPRRVHQASDLGWSRVVGRGPFLHLFTRSAWFRVDIRALS